MPNSVSFLASVVAGLTLSTVVMPHLSWAADNPNSNQAVAPNLEEQAVSSEPVSVNFPNVQAQIEADLKRSQTQGFAEIDSQLDHGQIAQPNEPDQTQLPSPQSKTPNNLQPVAMVKMADGNVYPVYVSDTQNFDGNLANAPQNAVAYLALPAQELSKQGVVMPLAEGVATIAPQAQVAPTTPQTKYITNAPQPQQAPSIQQYQKVDTNGQGVDPAYSPKVKVYGTNTPTFIGTRSETRNYINQLRESGAYSYNVTAPNYGNGGGYYYQYGSGYYNPYGSAGNGNYGYYQDSNGKWHVITGFRYDQSINNYVQIFKDVGSCVGSDCPVIIDPNLPYMGMPRPHPYPPQGPAAGQPPAWGPPPSYRPDPVDPGFTHPGGYYPRPPRPSYPHQPSRPAPVDPGFTHPFG